MRQDRSNAVGRWARWAPLALALAPLLGCGWNYARQMEKSRTPATTPAPPPATPTPPPPPTDPAARLEYDHAQGAKAQFAPEMEAHAFKVVMVDGFSVAQRLIHCTSGKVVHLEHRPSTAPEVENARAQGIPLGKWTLTTDTLGALPALPGPVLTNHINRYHRLEFVKRYDDGRTLYAYEGLKERAP